MSMPDVLKRRMAIVDDSRAKRRALAAGNRDAMPNVAALVDKAKKDLGDMFRKVRWAKEGDTEVGKRLSGNVVTARDMVFERKKS